MIRTRILQAILLASATLLAAGCGGGGNAPGATTATNGAPVPPTSEFAASGDIGIPFDILSGPLSISAITEPRTATARNLDEWNRLWDAHAGPGVVVRPAPKIDFSTNMVAAVFLGSRSACDSISVASVKQLHGPARLEVAYRESAPPAGTPCIASIANPAVLITLPQSTLPVEFVKAPARQQGDLLVRSGWWFGMCRTNCEGAVEIAKDGALFRAEHAGDSATPETGIWGKVSAKEWETISASFASLPDVIVGCPGCADEGVEWIEVEKDGRKKRLDFNCNTAVDGGEPLLATVRAIRSRLAAAAGVREACATDAILFEPLAPTVFASAIDEKRFVTVRDAAGWQALWNEHTRGASQAPAIDFSKTMVLGVFLGQESNPCGGMHIATVRQAANPDRIEVGYRVIDPEPNVVCIAAVINQYAFVTVPQSSLPVDFVRLK
ncbi:hypothetical protein [Noviherbaspirillum sp.]|uniref:hypothetical protein n=1 Tax=Noviherbaspirillum sp. TaxID=1926288 RepID=UPI002FE1C98B